jgi:hypothetical protein
MKSPRYVTVMLCNLVTAREWGSGEPQVDELFCPLLSCDICWGSLRLGDHRYQGVRVLTCWNDLGVEVRKTMRQKDCIEEQDFCTHSIRIRSSELSSSILNS